MADYLTRLASRHLKAGTAQPVKPFARSRSPIIEQDQRLALPGFRGSVPGDFGRGFPENPGADELLPISAMTAQRTPAASARLSARTGAAPGRGDFPSAATPSGMRPPPAGRMRRSGDQPSLDPSEGATRDTDLKTFIDPAPDFGEDPVPAHARFLPRVRPSNQESADPAENATASSPQSGGNLVTDLEEGASRAGDAGRTTPLSESSGAHEATTPREGREAGLLRPKPRDPGPADLSDFPPRDDDSTARAEGSPSVVIDRINVEVVAPAHSPAHEKTPRTGPLTAASASVIGPLKNPARTSRRLSLKHS